MRSALVPRLSVTISHLVFVLSVCLNHLALGQGLFFVRKVLEVQEQRGGQRVCARPPESFGEGAGGRCTLADPNLRKDLFFGRARRTSGGPS